jgi:tetratricopeptide (TPR) repeat protein
MRLKATGVVALLCCLSGAHIRALQVTPVVALLDRYRSGDFDRSVKELSGVRDPAALRAAFLTGAEEWIATDPADVAHRRLVAASLALEVGHARLSHDAESVVILLDWAMKTLRKQRPLPAERFWTLAAVALVQRVAVPGMLPDPAPGPMYRWVPEFLDNATNRFPDEPRLRLARLGQRMLGRSPNLSGVDGELERLARDATVAGDAYVERAYLRMFDRDCQGVVRHARTALDHAHEASTQYVAHFLIGYCHEAQGRLQDAVQAYASALQAVPDGQSASIALSLLLIRDGQAERAFDLIDRSMTARPDGDDPWRLLAYPGYVRWPILIADLRGALH